MSTRVTPDRRGVYREEYLEPERDKDEFRSEERALASVTMVARIESRMKLLGLNPFSAAKKAGLGGDYVRDIIRGKDRNPSAERLGKLAEALECSLYYLMGHEEIEARIVSHTPSGGHEAQPPPAPLPMWSPADGQPVARLLPIKFELMGDTYRKATDVVRPPVGYEAATVPLDYIDREAWWELVRDDSVSSVAPRGSLVLVVAMNDSERDQVGHGEFVIMSKRFIGPDSAFNLQERSMRRINYRYPDLGLWFADYAHGAPELDETDEVWRETEPTEPRKTLAQHAAEIEDPEERAAAEAANARLEAAIKLRRSDPNFVSISDRMADPKFVAELEASRIAAGRWRPKLVGKVLRVLTPIDARSRFGPS